MASKLFRVSSKEQRIFEIQVDDLIEKDISEKTVEDTLDIAQLTRALLLFTVKLQESALLEARVLRRCSSYPLPRSDYSFEKSADGIYCGLLHCMIIPI